MGVEFRASCKLQGFEFQALACNCGFRAARCMRFIKGGALKLFRAAIRVAWYKSLGSELRV